ncbi:MAG: UDP-N-acetylmuramoyl-tripeptide--D-alanyl-D-alanine ligase, partial [Cellulosilyticaceae bacterium]
FDGHHYISTVFEKGAIVVLSENKEVVDSRLTTIWVEDTKKALLKLSSYYRSLFNIPIIAVTGSVGKTTTKDMIAAVLSGKYNVHKTQGNYNNEIGLPLTLFELQKEHEIAVLEMGMNHFGEIHNLSITAKPHIGVITNIGTSHIENLGSREGILKAKLEILDGLEDKGLIVINGDDDLLETIKETSFPVLRCGKNNRNPYYAREIVCESMNVSAMLVTPKTEYEVQINAPGEHMIYNTLVAIAVAEELGLTKEEILNGINTYTPGKMRMNIIHEPNGLTIIDDTYNASPDSMKAAINVLGGYKTAGRKIAVLGDMLEMGEFAAQLHQEVGQYAARSKVDIICTVGSLAESIYEGALQIDNSQSIKKYTDKENLISDIARWIKKEDVILFKASRGMQFEKMVEAMGKVKLDEK